jgi:hypothetical protein
MSTGQEKSTPGPWERKRLDANHVTIHGSDGMTIVPRMISEPGTASEANGKLIEKAPSMLTVLEAIRDLIADATDKKIRTGRWSPIGNLLSEIQDSAQSIIDEARGS